MELRVFLSYNIRISVAIWPFYPHCPNHNLQKYSQNNCSLIQHKPHEPRVTMRLWIKWIWRQNRFPSWNTESLTELIQLNCSSIPLFQMFDYKSNQTQMWEVSCVSVEGCCLACHSSSFSQSALTFTIVQTFLTLVFCIFLMDCQNKCSKHTSFLLGGINFNPVISELFIWHHHRITIIMWV